MPSRLASIIIFGLIVSQASTTRAEDDVSPFGAISGSISGTTDYVARGVSLTRGNPAIQFSLEWARPVATDLSIYVGTFMSNVRIPDIDTKLDLPFHVEQDVNFGIRYTITESMAADIGYSLYHFPWYRKRVGAIIPDWREVYAKLDYDFKIGKLHAQWFHSENFSFFSGRSDYLSGTVEFPVGWQEINFVGHTGYFAVADEILLGLPNYLDFSIGLNRDVPELWGINIALNAYATNISRNAWLTGKGAPTLLDERVYRTTQPRIVLSIIKSF